MTYGGRSGGRAERPSGDHCRLSVVNPTIRGVLSTRGSVSLEHAVVVCCIGVACVVATSEYGEELEEGIEYCACRLTRLEDASADCERADEDANSSRRSQDARSTLLKYSEFAEDSSAATLSEALDSEATLDGEAALDGTQIAKFLLGVVESGSTPFDDSAARQVAALHNQSSVLNDATSQPSEPHQGAPESPVESRPGSGDPAATPGSTHVEVRVPSSGSANPTKTQRTDSEMQEALSELWTGSESSDAIRMKLKLQESLRQSGEAIEDIAGAASDLATDMDTGLIVYVDTALDYASVALSAHEKDVQGLLGADQHTARARSALIAQLTLDAETIGPIIKRAKLASLALSGAPIRGNDYVRAWEIPILPDVRSDYFEIAGARRIGAITQDEAAWVQDRANEIEARAFRRGTSLSDAEAIAMALREIYSDRVFAFLKEDSTDEEFATYRRAVERSPLLLTRPSNPNWLTASESQFLYNRLLPAEREGEMVTIPQENLALVEETLETTAHNIDVFQAEIAGWRRKNDGKGHGQNPARLWRPGDPLPEILRHHGIRKGVTASATEPATKARWEALDRMVAAEMRKQSDDASTSRAYLQIGGTVIGIGALPFTGGASGALIAGVAFGSAGAISIEHSVRLHQTKQDLQRRAATRLSGPELVGKQQELLAQAAFDREWPPTVLDVLDVGGEIIALTSRGMRLLAKQAGRSNATSYDPYSPSGAPAHGSANESRNQTREGTRPTLPPARVPKGQIPMEVFEAYIGKIQEVLIEKKAPPMSRAQIRDLSYLVSDLVTRPATRRRGFVFGRNDILRQLSRQYGYRPSSFEEQDVFPILPLEGAYYSLTLRDAHDPANFLVVEPAVREALEHSVERDNLISVLSAQADPPSDFSRIMAGLGRSVGPWLRRRLPRPPRNVFPPVALLPVEASPAWESDPATARELLDRTFWQPSRRDQEPEGEVLGIPKIVFPQGAAQASTYAEALWAIRTDRELRQIVDAPLESFDEAGQRVVTLRGRDATSTVSIGLQGPRGPRSLQSRPLLFHEVPAHLHDQRDALIAGAYERVETVLDASGVRRLQSPDGALLTFTANRDPRHFTFHLRDSEPPLGDKALESTAAVYRIDSDGRRSMALRLGERS